MANNPPAFQNFIAFAFLFSISSASAQNAPFKKQVDTIYSSVLNQKRIAWVYAPNQSNKPLPVVYVLDGEVNFDLVVNTVKQLKTQLIIVGVGIINPGTVDVNAERTRDYTPTHVSSSPYLDSSSARHSGGGSKFIQFLEKELIPYINAKYPVSSSKILIGHSFAGLTAINAAFNHPRLFGAYLAIDPSMWWDNEKLFKDIVAKNKVLSGDLFLAVASNKERFLISPSLDLVEHLKSKKNFASKFYSNNDHGSVVGPAVYDGLTFLLKNMK